MARESNRRESGRIMVEVECYGAATRQKGPGQVSELSHNGALVSRTEILPVRGELVGLGMDTANGPVLLIGWVTRHTHQGFAIEFDHLDQNAIDYIDNCSAVVPSRGRGRPSGR
jgi:PilZ domain